MEYRPRAPEAAEQVRRKYLYRDTRTLRRELLDALPGADVASLLAMISACVGIVFPVLGLASLVAIGIVTAIVARNRDNKTLPLRLPIELAPRPDYNRPGIGGKGWQEASGTILVGNIRRSQEEAWISGRDLLTHALVIGSTGSGKTETLVSLSAATAFCMGGGLMYVDAKGGVGLLMQFWTLAQMFGRTDDVRIINYLTGGQVSVERHWSRRSNTTNPFTQGTAREASNTLVALLPPSGGDNQYFLDRAIAILNTLMPALVELRDRGVLNIYPSLLSDFINITKFVELANDKVIVPGDDNDYSHIRLSQRVLRPLRAFLNALPGYDPAKPAAEQPEEVKRQFGFAEGYFSRALTNLAGQFAHIYQTELGEADFYDIVMHGRILVVAIPGAESMPEETKALGKVVLAAIRTAVATGLGNRSEGERAEILDALPIDLRCPNVLIVDEFAEIAIDGFATLLTQARGLGTACVVANQDLAGMRKANEIEAQQIFGNTNIKVLMKLADPDQTWRTFRDFAGDVDVARADGWERDNERFNPYRNKGGANIDRTAAVNINDLKEQTEGQAHLFQGAGIHRINTFFHGMDKTIGHVRYNRMCKVKRPSREVGLELRRARVITDCLREVTRGQPTEPLPTEASFSAELAGFLEGARRQHAQGDERWAWTLAGISHPAGAATDTQRTAEKAPEPAPERTPLDPPSATARAPRSASARSAPDAIKPAPRPPASPAPPPPQVSEAGVPGTHAQQEAFDEARLTGLHWVFEARSSHAPIGAARRLYERLVASGRALGQPEEAAAHDAASVVTKISAALDYPTAPPITSDPDRAELLLAVFSDEDEGER